jgi:diguanylate cyclase (GGDEF)-like protein/PAS domain S-box-containing protein
MILDRYSAPVIDPKGSYYGRIWTFRDITERKRNEDVLRQLSLTVEQSPVSVVITDPQGNITYVNRKFTESTGYASEEVVGKNPRILKSGRSSPEVYRTLWSTISQGQVWRGEFCNKKKNGEVFWEAATITPITNAKGAITHFLAVKEDITDRKQAEERLRLTQFSVEHASDAIFWMDAQARIVYVNRATCRSLGFSREELVSRSIPDIDPLLPRETWGGFWQDLKARGSLTFESQLQTKGGRIFPVEVTANHFAFDGQEYGFAFVRDITERRRAENELRLTQFSVEHASEAIRWFDAQGRLVYANQTACRSLGRSREEMASLSIEDIDALVPQETWGAFWEKLKTLGSMTFEGREKTKQGLFVPVEVTANYLEFDGQEYSFAFARDITERKRAEEKVRESSEQVRLLLDSIPEAVYGIDLHGKCTFCNPACLDLLGYQNASELLGRDMHVVLHHTRADGTPYPVEECHIFEAFRRGYGTHIDNEVLWRRDGTSFPAEYWSHPIRRDGNLVGTVVTFVDITERKRTQEALRESEERYRLLFERNMAGVFRTTLEGRILECNQAAASMLGYDSPEELLATPLARIHHSSSDREAFLRKLKSEKSLTNHETMLRRKNGESSWAMLNVSLVAGNSGAADIVEGTFVDITERKLAEKELRLMQFSLEHACDAVHWMNAEGRIVYANRASCRSLGRSREELLCLTIPDIDPRFPKERWQTFWEELKVRGSMTFETQHQTKQKHVFPVEITATYLNFDGQEYCFAFARDITERRVAEERVQSLAYYDALTGLPNRILLRDRLTQALATARRQKHQVALLFLDLDRFKIINDSLGHTVGDLLLQEVAERLQSFAREQDTVARLGGDEFLIVLTNVKDIPAAAVAAERFMDAMTVGFVIQGHSLSVSCSLGISIFPEHGADSETLIKNADAAMYSAKDAGRNNFQFFTADMTAKAVERLTLENNLRTALDRQELFLVYQPQMEIATGKIIGLEALIRWRHPELGLVPPDEFISIAENSGLIMPIGEWVLRTACAQARKWLEEGFAAVSVAVNVSAIQFRQEGFPDTVGRVLQETGLPPQCLELELTESLLLSNADVMFSVLRQLTAMGLRLAIDDFGTGYSSLSYLKHFPVSKLKIDRSFVRDVAVNPDDAAIATAIISMAKSLNLKVIAEGVEDEAQMSFLRTHQCDEIQGYYFSKPLAVDEVAGKMRATDAELQARAQANGK